MGIYYQLFMLSPSYGCLPPNWFSRNSWVWCDIPNGAFTTRHDHYDMLTSSSVDASWWILPLYGEVEVAYMAVKPLLHGRFSIVPRFHETMKALFSCWTRFVLHPLNPYVFSRKPSLSFYGAPRGIISTGFFLYFSYLDLTLWSNMYASFQSDDELCMRWGGYFLFQSNRNSSTWYILWLWLWTRTWRSTSARVLCLHAIN
jgi:hypothetical protein